MSTPAARALAALSGGTSALPLCRAVPEHGSRLICDLMCSWPPQVVPDVGYDDLGSNEIPGGATFTIDIELLAVKPPMPATA